MRTPPRRGRRRHGPAAPEQLYLRAMRFGWDLARGQATAVVDLDWGFAVLHDRFPVSQQHNRVVVTEADAPVDAVLDAADRILGGARLRYRRVDVEVSGGAPLSAALRAATGAEPGEELLLTMSLGTDRSAAARSAAARSTARRPGSPPVEVERLPFEATAELLDHSWRIDLPSLGAEARRQLVERVPEAAKVMHLTQHTVSQHTVPQHTASGDPGESQETEPVALCHLLHDGASAQIEGVYTLPEARRQGYASAIVADAVGLAAASGCDLVFLFADAGDHPQHLYRRLGFTDAGSTWTTLWARNPG